MTFKSQITALMRKELRIAKRNRFGTFCTLMLPLILGSLGGIWIYLLLHVGNVGAVGDLFAQDVINEFSPFNVWVGMLKNLSPIMESYESVVTSRGQKVYEYDNMTQALTNYNQINVNAFSGGFVLLNQTDPNGPLQLGFPVLPLSLWLTIAPMYSLASCIVPLSTEPTKTQYATQDKVFNIDLLFSVVVISFTIVSFMPNTKTTAGRMVEEKANRVKELLKVMGLTDSAYYGSHFAAALLRGVPGCGLLTISLYCFDVLTKPENCFLYFILCILFTFATTAYAFLMPALFSKNVWVNVCTMFFIIVSSQVCNFVTLATPSSQPAYLLIAPVAYFYGAMHLFWAGDAFDSPITLGFSMGMLIVDSLLYLFVAYYINSVFPGEFGVPRHPLFIFHDAIDFFKGLKSNAGKSDSSESTALMSESSSDNVIHFNKLTKKYPGSDVPAVHDLDLNVRKGEIFALLGHNGAGKTTTMNMLIGLLPATGYTTATVCGHDLTTNMNKIRANLGICPQFDVLFNDLTAREHFELFAELRGHSVEDANPRVTSLLQALQLPDDHFTVASKFSGGMKRRLSAGNALVGNNSIVVLDEPSSGLDPLSRRHLWQVIKAERQRGCTILLSTHFMEEADYLGDTIGIMSKGRMYCSGTSNDLKHRFGCGFYLKLVKSEEKQCDVERCAHLVTELVPGSRLEAQSSGDVTLLLPNDEGSIARFESLLRALDAEKSSLGIHSYGLSMNTLEDVFVLISLKEGATPEPTNQDAARIHNMETVLDVHGDAATLLTTTFEEDVETAKVVPYLAKVFHQFCTLITRRYYTFLRNKTLWVFFFFIPMLIIVFPLIFMAPSNDDSGNDWWKPSVFTSDFMDYRALYFDTVNTDFSDSYGDALKTVYPKLIPNGKVQFLKVNDFSLYRRGTYMPTSKVSYAMGSQGQKISGFYVNQFDAQTKNITLLLADGVSLAETFMLGTVMRAALQYLQNSTQQFTPIDFTQLPLPNPTTMPTPTPTSTPTPTPSTLKNKKLSGDNNNNNNKDNTPSTILLQISAIASIILATSLSVVMVAEEFNRGIYSNLRVGGMLPLSYFLSNVVHDLFWCSLPYFMIVCGTYIVPIDQLKGAPLGVYFLAFFLFCAHVSLQSQCLAIWRNNLKSVTYMVIMDLFTIACGAVPYLAYLAFSAAITDSKAWNKLGPWWINIAPPAAFYTILDKVGSLGVGDYDPDKLFEFGDKGIGTPVFLMCIELFIPIAYITMFARDWRVGSCGGNQSNANVSHAFQAFQIPGEDDDVTKERYRVSESSDRIRALAVVKVYDPKTCPKVAVNNVTLGVKRGECFGLLGPNGAGKTTFIRQLIGEMDPTTGLIEYEGVNRGDSKTDLYTNGRLGICQQHDALWDYLTGRQHMEIYIKMRLTSVFQPQHLDHIKDALHRVHLLDDSDKLVRGFSGGMKRKLGVALAMFTGAQTVFLDEPSTGMDPFARRALWKVIHDAIGCNRAVVLTTHSMEEADSVCGRIGIITDGQLRCIGNSQHLKNKFGGGYVLTVFVDSHVAGSLAAADGYVMSAFPTANLTEGLETVRRYALGNVSCLADVFGTMEKAKGTVVGMQSYSIAQTSSLEQIFLRFVGAGALL